jgi:putative CRISPR-associated protein (TIGR02620 family)
MSTKIITRHRGAIAWLESKGIKGEVIEQASPSDFNEGDEIYGVMPIQLIAEGIEKGCDMNIIVLPKIPREMRGKELTAEEMEELGGVEVLKVKALKLERLEL